MKNETTDEMIASAINNITEKVSTVMLQEFLSLPHESQFNFVLVKSAQLLLANVLCYLAPTKAELESIMNIQGIEIKELTLNCASSGFSEKFCIQKH